VRKRTRRRKGKEDKVNAEGGIMDGKNLARVNDHF
jgi:hypothetical protein